MPNLLTSTLSLGHGMLPKRSKLCKVSLTRCSRRPRKRPGPSRPWPTYVSVSLDDPETVRGSAYGAGPGKPFGFSGRLHIPTHNFTSREYFINAGEGLVYFEFTKLSWSNDKGAPPNPGWVPQLIEAQPPFPKSKAKRRTIDDYLADATGGGPPASAIGTTLYEAGKQAQRARSLIAAIGIGAIAGAIGLVYTSWSLYSSAQQFTAAAQTELRQERQRSNDRIEMLERKLKEAEASIEAVKSRVRDGRRQRRLRANGR